MVFRHAAERFPPASTTLPSMEEEGTVPSLMLQNRVLAISKSRLCIVNFIGKRSTPFSLLNDENDLGFSIFRYSVRAVVHIDCIYGQNLGFGAARN